MKKIKLEDNNNPRFELVIQIRDSLGNPTGKTKSITTDKAEELDTFLQRNVGTVKNKNKNEKNIKEEKNNVGNL